jgi:MFS family permease
MVFLGLLVLVLALDQGSGPEVITVPLILVGIGIGALAPQLGAVTVSAVPDEKSSEVGGLQYTVINLGASIGTALAGAVLISVLTTTFLSGVANNPAVPQEMSSKAQVELSAGIPFVSDAQLQSALQSAGVPSTTAQAVTDQNAASRINGLRASIALLALIALIALAMTRRLPVRPVGVEGVAPAEADEDRERARPPPA